MSDLPPETFQLDPNELFVRLRQKHPDVLAGIIQDIQADQRKLAAALQRPRKPVAKKAAKKR